MMKYVLKEGKNLRTESPIFYAMAAPVSGVVKIDNLAKEISRECTLTPHDIRAVISAMEERIIEHMQNGQSVRLGLLGSFRPTIKSKSTAKAEAFSNSNIRGVAVAFTPSSTMRYELSKDNPDMEFQMLKEKDEEKG